jgi:hypothetical protein
MSAMGAQFPFAVAAKAQAACARDTAKMKRSLFSTSSEIQRLF